MIEFAYIGEIRLFCGPYAPEGWLPCDGRTLSTMEYNELYAVIGNAYGGDGTSNFKLPDLRGRVPIGSGKGEDTSLRLLGESGGIEDTLIAIPNLPPHNHEASSEVRGSIRASGTTKCTDHGAVSTNPICNNLCETNMNSQPYSSGAPNRYMANNNVDIRVNTASLFVQTETEDTGDGKAMDNMPPYVTIGFIICVEGVFPPRP